MELPESKLSVVNAQGELNEFSWGDTYQLQEYSWGSRVLCSTSGDRVEFLMHLLERYPGPFEVIYILEDNTSTPDYAQGRYRSPNSLSPDQVRYFLHEFSDFIQNDGRHHLMIGCQNTKGIVYYDQHDYFFVYGELDSLLSELRGKSNPIKDYSLAEHGHRIGESESFYRLMRFWPWEWQELEITDINEERIGRWQSLKMRLRAWWHRWKHTRQS